MFSKCRFIVYEKMHDDRWIYCVEVDYEFLWLKWTSYEARVNLYDENHKTTPHTVGRGHSFTSYVTAIDKASVDAMIKAKFKNQIASKPRNQNDRHNSSY